MDDAQKRAKKKYQSKVKRFTVDFYPTETELWEHLQTQEKKQTYIKDLIRADIENHAEWVQTSALCNPYCSNCNHYNDRKTVFCPCCGKEMGIKKEGNQA